MIAAKEEPSNLSLQVKILRYGQDEVIDFNRVWLAKQRVADITGLSLKKVNDILERD